MATWGCLQKQVNPPLNLSGVKCLIWPIFSRGVFFFFFFFYIFPTSLIVWLYNYITPWLNALNRTSYYPSLPLVSNHRLLAEPFVISPGKFCVTGIAKVVLLSSHNLLRPGEGAHQPAQSTSVKGRLKRSELKSIGLHALAHSVCVLRSF